LTHRSDWLADHLSAFEGYEHASENADRVVEILREEVQWPEEGASPWPLRFPAGQVSDLTRAIERFAASQGLIEVAALGLLTQETLHRAEHPKEAPAVARVLDEVQQTLKPIAEWDKPMDFWSIRRRLAEAGKDLFDA
jgi:hypothetical protein